MIIKVVLLAALFVALSAVGFAQSKNKAVEPNVVVKNLYAAQAAGSGPFFQTKNRAVLDKYFTKALADLIWKDAVSSKGEVGAIDFDPLYGSQDPQITDFNIMETGWGGDSKFGPADEAVVQVTFKDSGTERMVSFQFKQGGDKRWKIYDVHYRNADGEVRLAEILNRNQAETRTKRCGLNLSVTEADAAGSPVQNVTATATNLSTKKVSGARLFEAMPAFDNLREGRYRITVKKAGYQTTVKEVNIDCGNLEADDPSVTENIFLQKGRGTQVYDQPASSANVAPPGIRGVDFLNHSYQGSVCSEDVGFPKTVEVSGGKFKAGDNYFEVDKSEIAYGDVNGDRSEDAVVYIRCGSAAGTLRAFEVHAYSFENGEAKLLARLDSTGLENDYRKSYAGGTLHYAGERGPKIVNGHVIVEALADGSFAGPENVATFDYQLSGGRFVLSGKPARAKRAP